MWLDILKDLISSYNDIKHRTIGMKPKGVAKQNEKKLLFSVYKNYSVKQAVKKPKFKVGDKVRISKFEQVFEKGYTPNCTTKIVTVNCIKNTESVTHIL